MAAGKSLSREFHTSRPPADVIRDVVMDEKLGGGRYTVESHTPEAVVLSRRFTPEIVYDVPLGVAVLAIVIPVIFGDLHSAEVGGRVALFAVIAAVVLTLLVKTTEHVTISATAEGDGSRILVSGRATPALRKRILAFAERADTTTAEHRDTAEAA